MLVWGPISILIHELGHAIGILLTTKEREANLYLGAPNSEGCLKFKIGRVNFHLRFASGGFCYVKKEETDKYVEKISPMKEIIILASGPIFSLMAALILFILSYYLEGSLKRLDYAFTILSFATFLNTAIPHKYKSRNTALNGIRSDGLIIKEILQNNREGSIC